MYTRESRPRLYIFSFPAQDPPAVLKEKVYIKIYSPRYAPSRQLCLSLCLLLSFARLAIFRATFPLAFSLSLSPRPLLFRRFQFPGKRRTKRVTQTNKQTNERRRGKQRRNYSNYKNSKGIGKREGGGRQSGRMRTLHNKLVSSSELAGQGFYLIVSPPKKKTGNNYC